MPLFSSPHPAAPSQRNPLRTKTNEPSSSSTSAHRRPGRSDGKGTFAIDMLRQMRGEGWDDDQDEDEQREARRAQKRASKPGGKRTGRVREAGNRAEDIAEGDENANTSTADAHPSLGERIKERAISPPRAGRDRRQEEGGELEVEDDEAELEVAPLSVHDQFGFGLSVQRLKAQPPSSVPLRRLRAPTPPPREKTPSLPSLPSTPSSVKIGPDSAPPDPPSDDDGLDAILPAKRRRKVVEPLSSSPPKGPEKRPKRTGERLRTTRKQSQTTSKPTKKTAERPRATKRESEPAAHPNPAVPPARKGKKKAVLPGDEDASEGSRAATGATSSVASTSRSPMPARLARTTTSQAPPRPPPAESRPIRRPPSTSTKDDETSQRPRRQSGRLAAATGTVSSSPPVKRKPRPRPKARVSTQTAVAGSGAATPSASAAPTSSVLLLEPESDPTADLPPSSPPRSESSHATVRGEPAAQAAPSQAVEEEVLPRLDSDDLYS